MQQEIYYHATLKSNIQAIYERGIDPRFTTGKERKAWYVTQDGLLWAIGHTALRHNVPLSEISIIPVHVSPGLLANTRWENIYACNHTLLPTNHPRSAANWFKDLHPAEREAV